MQPPSARYDGKSLKKEGERDKLGNGGAVFRYGKRGELTKVLKSGNSKDILNDVKFLIDNNIEPPYLSKLTYLAKEKKGIKLFYQNDVRDVMKDVYKHVK